MTEQLIFDFPRRNALGRDDFFRSQANEMAVRAVENWSDWENRRLIVTGPQGAGKSHLAKIWCEEARAVVIAANALGAQDIGAIKGNVCVEDVQEITGDLGAQEALFHLYNLIDANGGFLMLTGRGSAVRWADLLADLNSRLNSVTAIRVEEPDDELLFAVMLKQFEDRQLNPQAKVVNFLMSRMERSFAFVDRMVGSLDETALRERKPITVPMARAVLDKLAASGDTGQP